MLTYNYQRTNSRKFITFVCGIYLIAFLVKNGAAKSSTSRNAPNPIPLSCGKIIFRQIPHKQNITRILSNSLSQTINFLYLPSSSFLNCDCDVVTTL